MKKLLTILLSIFCCTLMAQAPQKFNFQAIARSNDPLGATLGNTTLPTISVGISPNADGSSAVYFENFTNVKTSPWGLFSLSIGTGSVTFGTFNTINWGSGNWYLRVQIGSPINFDVTTQLLSVPFALVAKNAERVKSIPYAKTVSTGSWLNSSQKDTWLSHPNLRLTVPESGTYLVNAAAGVYGSTYDCYGRVVVVSNTQQLIYFGIGSGGGSDYAATSEIVSLTAGQIIQIEVSNSGSGTWYYGRGSLSIVRLGD